MSLRMMKPVLVVPLPKGVTAGARIQASASHSGHGYTLLWLLYTVECPRVTLKRISYRITLEKGDI